MNFRIKIPFFSILLFCTALLFSCSEIDTSQKSEAETEIQSEKAEIDHQKIDSTEMEPAQTNDPITVMVIPCSNGYEYNLKMGDLNPSLEKYLKNDPRISLVPFPLKKMNGSGYFGIFNKKDCAEIIKNTDVDFLIMTRMQGMDLLTTNSEKGNWGYDTKVLNVSSMTEFPGIKAKNLETFEKIDGDIGNKIGDLVELIVETSRVK